MKSIYMLILVLFLTACANEKIAEQTPEEFVDQFYADFNSQNFDAIIEVTNAKLFAITSPQDYKAFLQLSFEELGPAIKYAVHEINEVPNKNQIEMTYIVDHAKKDAVASLILIRNEDTKQLELAGFGYNTQ